MKKSFKQDYLNVNHSILEMLFNLSGDIIDQGKINPKSVLFRKNKLEKVIEEEIPKEFFLKQNFNKFTDSESEEKVNDNSVRNVQEMEKNDGGSEILILGEVCFYMFIDREEEE